MKRVLAAAILVLLGTGCDRPFVPVAPPSIEILAPDMDRVQPDSLVVVRVRSVSFRSVAGLEVDGTPVTNRTDDTWQFEVRLARGENRFVLRAFDEDAVTATDTLRLFYGRRTFRAAPTPSQATGGASAVLLGDGRVLVCGGAPRTGAGAERTCAVFDQESQSWAGAGHLAIGRTGHTSTLLPDGRILVVGGSRADDPDSVAVLVEEPELLDPRTGQSIILPVSGSPVRRMEHTTTWRYGSQGVVLDLLGGTGDIRYGSRPALGTRQDLRSFLFRNDSLFALGPAIGPYIDLLAGHSQTVLEQASPGSLALWFVTGAIFANGGTDARTLRLDTRSPLGFLVEDLAPPVIPRTEHEAVEIGPGQVLLLGGRFSASEVGTGTDLWVNRFGRFLRWPDEDPVRGIPRRKFTATLLPGGRILVSGGFDAAGEGVVPAEYLTVY